jgi:ABC-2 type transport system ATP-binding protein
VNDVIQTEGLTVRYGLQEALSSLDVRVAPGTVGLLGPNGAGKSTLLKTLLGFIQPASGRVEVLGFDMLSQAREIRLRVGYFPERMAYIPDLNAVETVALAGELGGLPRSTALERAHEVLRFAGLGEARYRPVETYSTGMLQRTKLAIALVHDPELLFLDEPTSGMDPSGRRQMLDLIQQVSRRHGISVLLSTHLLHDVESVCDGVVLLQHGKLVMQGSLDVLKRSTGRIYQIRAREEVKGRFAAALADKGIDVKESEEGLLNVTVKDDDTRTLFAVARDAGAELRHLERFEPSLEEVFLAAVGHKG